MTASCHCCPCIFAFAAYRHIKALSTTERSLKMSEKRKDNKGRVLKTGESQRKDLIYQYRYTDIHGKRQTVYSSDLKELREKEKVIQRQLDDGIDYAAGEVTVIALLERYISLKQGVRYNTKIGYNFVLNLIKKEDFGYRQIRNIKVSDAQQWIMKLHNDGKGYSTITSVRGVVKPAFQMAYNEDIIRRNPFDFKLIDVVPNDSQKRIAMTEEQQELWMGFIRKDKTYTKYYDEFVVLLGTGMRVSEFCGLTKCDLDFEPENPCGSSACQGTGRKVLCGKNKNRVRMPFYPNDRGSVSQLKEYPCQPSKIENRSNHRRLQRFSSD